MDLDKKLRYNPLSLGSEFRNFLLSGKALSTNTVKNYLSDMRHFFGWRREVTLKKNSNDVDICRFIVFEDILEYRNYLVKSSVPSITINRRLSALRIFFDYCINNGYMFKNPARRIHNIPKKTSSYQIVSLYLENTNNTDKENLKEFISFITNSTNK